jgi:hemerythrin
MEIEYIQIVLNAALTVVLFVMKRSLEDRDKAMDEIRESLSALRQTMEEHKEDDHMMALDIAELKANRQEHVRMLAKLEQLLERLRENL